MHILNCIEEKVHIRRDEWRTREVELLPPAEWMDEYCIISRYAAIGLETRRRFLWNPILVSVNGTKDTPSALARDYLKIKYERGPKWTRNQRLKVETELSKHPLYCRPATFERGFYIDIASAYWSVMVRCGWNVNYYPGRWLGITIPPLDFPFYKDKRARNSLVSVARSNKMTMYNPETKRFFTQKRGNPRANSQLYCLITDTLNAIACEVISAGAVYVFTDGYIAPNLETKYRIMQIIRDWGFTPRIKGEGSGRVTALGSYIVGRYHSRELQKQNAPYKSVKKLWYHKWLRDRMAWARSLARWHDSFV